MALAGSLDEIIAVHEAYLFSVQRQCFVAPDKLVLFYKSPGILILLSLTDLSLFPSICLYLVLLQPISDL